MQTEDVAKMFFECVLVVNELEQLRSLIKAVRGVQIPLVMVDHKALKRH